MTKKYLEAFEEAYEKASMSAKKVEMQNENDPSSPVKVKVSA